MNQSPEIETSVEEATAAALSDALRLETVGRPIDRFVGPDADDPLITLFERTAAEASKVGLTDDEVDAELAVYNAERRV